MMTCVCRSRQSGFTLVGGWWVCARCFLPAKGYAEAALNGRLITGRNKEEENVGLVYFEGGPLDAHAYETSTLMSREAIDLPVLEYVWTSDKKTSERTGSVAQVWRHKTLIGGAKPDQPNPATVTQLAAEAPAAPAAPTPAAVPAPPVPGAMTGAAGPNDSTVVDVPAPAPAPAEEAAASAMPATGSTENLLERRKALKLSRAQVSDRSGLAQSKIASIEAGTGKRVKPEEVQQLADAIAAFESERDNKNSVGSVASAHA